MTVGIIDRPEKARQTLNSYGITLRKARLTVENMFREDENEEEDDAKNNGEDDGDKNNKPKKNSIFAISPQLLNMNRKARDVELPFAPPLKRVLSRAGSIADSLESPSVNSEHVLLSLLGYDASLGRVPDEIDASVEERGYARGALAVFLRMEGVSWDSSTFSAAEFCRRLIMDMKYPSSGSGSGGGELVTGVSDKKSSTPTLNDVGTDLTDLATRMELDPVHGRDLEIQSALRTLVRRRKNNPCLMGEPGVGKTAIAEGVAQILAAPNMLERLDELFDRSIDSGTNGEDLFTKQEEVNRIQQLAKLCPAKLRNHRVVSLELANLVAGTKYRGEFEERLQAIVEEVTDERAPPTILFIDGK
jgi:ATP-dependent Clp protease ATP-binding subunit ClpC